MQICREFDLVTTGAGIQCHAAGYFVADDVIRTGGIRLIDEETEVADTEDAPAATFAGHFGKHTGPVGRFSNFSGDAMLVVPAPLDANTDYSHLAAFVRGAPVSQQRAFWQAVGEAVRGSLSERVLWLSTSGLGVYWLHVRLDSRPKYYTYQPYTGVV